MSRRDSGTSSAGSALGRLERAHLELEPVAEALHAAEHAHGVALAEAAVEELDVVPDARLDLPGRVDELEREVRASRTGAEPLLARHRVEALDDPVLGQLRDRHPGILGPGTDGKLARSGPAEAVSRPALRRGDGGAARRSGRPSVRRDHPGGARSGCWPAARGTSSGSSVPTTPRRPPARSPTGASAACSSARSGPPSGSLEEEYTGPDGSAGARRGLVARVRLKPYDDGVVLPHEGTFTAPKEARLRLLRATRVKPSPIFLLHHGGVARAGRASPTCSAELDGVVSRLWRIDDPARDRAHRSRRRGAAPDRRRPPPLRDGAALPRGGGERGDRPTSSPCSSAWPTKGSRSSPRTA